MHYRVEEHDLYPRDEANTFEVPDDATILTAEWRGANRLVVAVAIPVTRCIAETADGVRCRNDAVDGEPVCGVHKD